MNASYYIRSLRTAVRLAFILLFAVPAENARANENAAVNEYRVKAAFLFNLAKFVDWPEGKLAEADSPLKMGVAGQAAFAMFQEVLKDKAIGQHKLVVQLVESEEEAKACQILFVSRQTRHAEGMVQAAGASGVLTTGETDTFLESGGMICFYLESDNLRLQIDGEAVRKHGLVIKAAALATLVNKGIAKMRKN